MRWHVLRAYPIGRARLAFIFVQSSQRRGGIPLLNYKLQPSLPIWANLALVEQWEVKLLQKRRRGS